MTTLLATVRRVARQHAWQVLTAAALLQLAAACPELQGPGGGGGTPTTVAAPTNLTANATSTTQISLAWTDNSSNEDGFRIERAPGGTTNFVEIATVAAGTATYQNTGLTESTPYSYRVRAYAAAVMSSYSATATATTQLAAPPAPSNLLASGVSSTQINLTWIDNSNNEDGFRLERSSNGTVGPFTEIAVVTAGTASYQNVGLPPSTGFTYRIRSYNTAGTSAYSNNAAGFTQATPLTPPNAPSGLIATAASATQINLSWTDNADNESGFQVERAPGTTSSFTAVATLLANVTSYQNLGLTAATQYTYRVRAINAAGNSAYSGTATATTSGGGGSPPAAPSGLAATPVSSSQINLSWTDNSNNEDGFRIERAPGGTTTFSEIAVVPAGSTSYQDGGLVAATAYTYRVRAYNGAGNSSYSLEVTATTSGGANPPAAPSSLGATAAASAQINLAWTDNSSDEDGFRIERCQGASCSNFAEIIAVAAGVTTYQNTGLTASTQYTYRVRAYNGAGSSSYSGTASATTSAPGGTPPAAPSALGAAAASPAQINLTWTDNANNEDGFRIERCTGAACSSFAEITTVPAGADNYQSTGLTEGTSYSFRVRAYNGAGNSGYSNTASATTETPIPTLPTNLVATAASTSQINLTWNDNSTNEVGFKIERCTGAACGTFAEIATVGAGVAAYQNTGLSASTLYRYRVRAYNLGGNSAYSDPAEATTQAAQTPPNAPSGLGATAASSTQIDLAWTDNSSNEDGFAIERCTGVSCSNFTTLISVGAGVTAYQNTGLSASTSYSYRVLAYNGAGGSAYSATATAVTLGTPPAAPSGLTATAASDVQINLAWTDNSSNETGFTIEQAPGGTSNFTVLATVPAGTVSAQNNALPTGTTYHYRVKATNAGGSSAYSNTATATTWAVVYASAANTMQVLFTNGVQDVTYSNTVYNTGPTGVGCNVIIGGTSAAGCYETALQFSGFGTAVSGKTISAVYLRLSPQSLASNFNSVNGVYLFGAAWNPSTLTYNNQPGVTGHAPVLFAPPSTSVQLDLNITSLAQAWTSGTTNNGMVITPTSTPAGAGIWATFFWSDDTYNSILNYRPMLIIIFQ